MTPLEKLKAWCNFLPCLSFWTNAIALPSSIWALIGFLNGYRCFPLWIVFLSLFNILWSSCMLCMIYYQVWKRTALVLGTKRARLWYLLRINPIMAVIWWWIWIIPLWIGYRMYMGEGGLVWARTQKIDANAKLFKSKIIHWFREK